MLRISRTLASSLAVLIVAGAMAPAANAWPFGRRIHLSPGATQAQDRRISVLLFNKGQLFQDLNVDGHVYTVMPHQSVSIKAPAGTGVYAASTGFGHRKGDLLFEITAQMKGAKVSFD